MEALGVSAPGESGSVLMLIVPLSEMFFMFPFKNSSVSRFSPNGRKWASGAMDVADISAPAAVVAESAAAKTAASGVGSFLRVMVRSVLVSVMSLFILMLTYLRFSEL